MNETKHTPGPWRISGESATTVQADYRAINSEGGVLIATALGYPNSGYFPSDDEATANAALIAAAPELLEAAEGIVSRWDSPLWKDQPHTGIFIDRLRAAIAKAKGEQP